MGKFERAFRKKYKQEVPSYETWRAENSHRFPQPAQSPEQIEDGHVMAKRRFPAWGWGALAGAAVLLALILTLVFSLRDYSSTTPISDFTFGEDKIYSISMTEEDVSTCQQYIPYFSELNIVDGVKRMHVIDDSLVLYVINSELQTESDYYFIESRIVFNEYFIPSDIGQYSNLDNYINADDIQVSYAIRGTDQYGFTEYNVLSEYEDVTIYWTVSSINDQFDEWLQLTFAA